MTSEREAVAAALPGYELGGVLGSGAFGVVYEGRHLTLGRAVAVKHLPISSGTDPSMRDRFLVEARVVASLDHPHIVPVYDFIERDGLRLLVMELLKGGTLTSRLSAGVPTARWSCAVAIAISLGLHHAHERGVLHRDVKPDNVLFSGETPKLADFGIAKDTSGDSRLTQTGTVIGTISYMSPEQASGEALGPASDVYSCAVLLFELLAGRLPFKPVDTVTARLVQRVTTDALHLSTVAPDIPIEIGDVISDALMRDPGARTPSAGAFAVRLDTACRAVFGPRWITESGVRVVGLDSVAASIPETSVPARTGSNDPRTTRLVTPGPIVGDANTGSAPTVVSNPQVSQAATAHREATEPTTPASADATARPTRLRWLAGGLAAAVLTGGIALAVSNRSSSKRAAPSIAQVAPSVPSSIAEPIETAPAPVVSSTVLPTTIAVPTTLPPTTLPPTTLPPTTLPPTTLPPTTLPPTTLPPTTLPPTTIAVPTTLPPTTLPPTTLPPTTLPPTTLPPTTLPPTTIAVTTLPPTAPVESERAGGSSNEPVPPARVVMLQELNRLCLDRGFASDSCTCIVTQARTLTNAQLANLVAALNAGDRLGPRAAPALRACGITIGQPSGAPNTAPLPPPGGRRRPRP